MRTSILATEIQVDIVVPAESVEQCECFAQLPIVVWSSLNTVNTARRSTVFARIPDLDIEVPRPIPSAAWIKQFGKRFSSLGPRELQTPVCVCVSDLVPVQRFRSHNDLDIGIYGWNDPPCTTKPARRSRGRSDG